MLQSENRKKSWVPYMILIPITLPIVIMFVWLFLASISDRMTGIVPEHLTAKNWTFLWQPFDGGTTIWPYLANTCIYAFLVMVLEVFIASLGAYAVSRLNFPGRRYFLSFIIILHAFPIVTLIIAIFWILKTLGLYDTVAGTVIVKVAFETPFALWIMKGFFDSVPWDVEIAAMVDGASRWKIWRKIVMPIVRPGLTAVCIFAFLTGWSEFLIPYIFAPNSTSATLSILVNSLMSEADKANYGLVAAVGVFYVIPVLFFYTFTQKYLLHIYSGGVKG